MISDVRLPMKPSRLHDIEIFVSPPMPITNVHWNVVAKNDCSVSNSGITANYLNFRCSL